MKTKRSIIWAACSAALGLISSGLIMSIPLHEINKAHWPYYDVKYVRAYLYNLDNNLYGNHAIVKGNKLDPTVVGEGILLNQKQVETLAALTNKDIQGLIEGLSKSYIPHHGFVFYDKDNQPIAYITLCFDCEAIRVWPEIRESTNKKSTTELSDKEVKVLLDILEQYKRIVLELKLPVLETPFEYEKLKEENN